MERLRQDFAVEWTYHSNGIEGNTLTISKTKFIIEDVITVGDKTLKKHFRTTASNIQQRYTEYF